MTNLICPMTKEQFLAMTKDTEIRRNDRVERAIQIVVRKTLTGMVNAISLYVGNWFMTAANLDNVEPLDISKAVNLADEESKALMLIRQTALLGEGEVPAIALAALVKNLYQSATKAVLQGYISSKTYLAKELDEADTRWIAMMVEQVVVFEMGSEDGRGAIH